MQPTAATAAGGVTASSLIRSQSDATFDDDIDYSEAALIFLLIIYRNYTQQQFLFRPLHLLAFIPPSADDII